MSWTSSSRLLVVGLLVALSLPATASAQEELTLGLDIQRFVPAANNHSFVLVDSTRLVPKLTPALDVLFDYGHRPLQISSASLSRQDGLVDGLVSGHFRFSMAFAQWAQLDVFFPFINVAVAGGRLPTDAPPASFGDIWVQGSFRLLDDQKIIGLALKPFLTLPTGNKEIYTTSGVPTLGVKVAVEKRFKHFHVAGHLGYRFKPGQARPVSTLAVDDEIMYGVGVGVIPLPGKLMINAELVGGGVVGPQRGAVQQIDGSAGLHSPLEFIVDARIMTPVGLDIVVGGGPGLTPAAGVPQFRIFGGVQFAMGDTDGDGILGDDDACPQAPEDFDGFEDGDGCPEGDNDKDGVPDKDDQCVDVPEDEDGFEDTDGCPDIDNDKDGIPDNGDRCPDRPEDKDKFEDHDGCPESDNDVDGVLDVDDKCPNKREDKDGFEDADGCPDPDNDGDGILDRSDICPDIPEVINNFKDEDGCPDDMKAVVIGDAIVIFDKVFFKTGKATILKKSYSLLNAVAQTLQDNLQITLLEVQGHTDSDGEDSYNLDLSNRRAASVMNYLTAYGVDKARLQSKGYGETVPLSPNESDEGKAKNRRVEFKIISQDRKTEMQGRDL
jgi:outer membrane protein OmpA-like peptidoglycan-associated protein